MRKGFNVAIYTVNNYEVLNDIYFHDSELKDALVNYNKKEIEINLRTAKTQDMNSLEIKLFFYDVRDFHVPMLEPWGYGFYIYSIDFIAEDKCIKSTITLNSGDVITCVSEIIETDYSY